jgi:hypothetical protein
VVVRLQVGGHAAVDHRQLELLRLGKARQRQVAASSCCTSLVRLRGLGRGTPSTAMPWSAANTSSCGSVNWA